MTWYTGGVPNRMANKDEEDMLSLEAILDYDMTDQEAKAFKACLIWVALNKRILPDHKSTRLPRKGDPRKCHLFRIMWKFLRETNGIVKDEEIGLFIRAQLEILKGIRRDNAHVLIDPGCLVGEKAWIRWKVWNRKYACAGREEDQHRKIEEMTPLFRIAQDLEKTRTFLDRQESGVEEMMTSGDLARWIKQGKVSPYYVLMSPLVASNIGQLNPDEYFAGVDLGLYRSDITPAAEDAFRLKFNREFG